MGTAHINIHPSLYDEIVQRDDISVITMSEFGDGTLICLIETSLIPSGYHGHMNMVLTKSGNDVNIKLKKDVDT